MTDLTLATWGKLLAVDILYLFLINFQPLNGFFGFCCKCSVSTEIIDNNRI